MNGCRLQRNQCLCGGKRIKMREDRIHGCQIQRSDDGSCIIWKSDTDCRVRLKKRGGEGNETSNVSVYEITNRKSITLRITNK